MRKSTKENAIVVCVVVLCFMVTIGLCAVYSGEGILGVFSFAKSNDERVYALTIGGYDDMTLARTTSDLIRKRGGAGYVVKGDTIEIIYAVYPDEESAKKVLSALDDGSAYIKPIEIKSSKLKWADSSIKSAVQTALGYYELTFNSLYTTANSLYDKSINSDDAKTELSVLKTRLDDLKSTFYGEVAGNDSDQLTQVKLALITTLALLENVNPANDIATFTSSLRYALVQLVTCRQALMNSI